MVVVVTEGRKEGIGRFAWLGGLTRCDGLYPLEEWWFEHAQRRDTHWRVGRCPSPVYCCRLKTQCFVFLVSPLRTCTGRTCFVFDEVGESEEVRNFIITRTAFARIAVATSPAELYERIENLSLPRRHHRWLSRLLLRPQTEHPSASAGASARPTCSSVALPPASSPSTALASRITTTLRPGPWEEQVKTDE